MTLWQSEPARTALYRGESCANCGRGDVDLCADLRCFECCSWSHYIHPGEPLPAAPHSAAPHSLSPPFLHNPSNSQIPPKGPTQMVEMSKGGVTPSGSNPAGVAPPTTENQTGHSAAPEQSAVPAHTEGPFCVCFDCMAKTAAAHKAADAACGREWLCQCGACKQTRVRSDIDEAFQVNGVREYWYSIADEGETWRRAVPAHTEAVKTGIREPLPGDALEYMLDRAWHPCTVRATYPGSTPFLFEIEVVGGSIWPLRIENHGRVWRWPAQGGGSAERPYGTCIKCGGSLGASGDCFGAGCREMRDLAAELTAAGIPDVGGGSAEEPAPLPPVQRCPERVSTEGEAIENCDAVIGRDVQCFVCLGVRCYIHCGCLAHNKSAKVVARGGQGSFEWCVWEFEHAFRGQLYCKAAGGAGLVILGTHGGVSSDAVLTILLRSLERIQGRKVRGEVIVGRAAASRRTNEAAGELTAGGDPEHELRELDAKVVLLLEQSKRQRAKTDAEVASLRVWALRICQDWLKSTEQTWRDLADDGEQNPRLVFQCKELHDQQAAELFFQLGQLFAKGGES